MRANVVIGRHRATNADILQISAVQSRQRSRTNDQPEEAGQSPKRMFATVHPLDADEFAIVIRVWPFECQCRKRDAGENVTEPVGNDERQTR